MPKHGGHPHRMPSTPDTHIVHAKRRIGNNLFRREPIPGAAAFNAVQFRCRGFPRFFNDQRRGYTARGVGRNQRRIGNLLSIDGVAAASRSRVNRIDGIGCACIAVQLTFNARRRRCAMTRGNGNAGTAAHSPRNDIDHDTVNDRRGGVR